MEVQMSDSTPSPGLPARASLDQLRKQAKELRESGAFPTLAAAQLALARRYGFASWPKLKLATELATLRRLIDEGDVAGVRRLLAESPRLATATFPEGDTPLHAAAEQNGVEIVEVLVRAGAPFTTAYGESAHSALSWALTVEAFDAARKLVELGDEPDLFCAAGLGLMDRVRGFWPNGKLRHHPSKTGSSRTAESGEPLPRPPADDRDQISDALYIACRVGQLESARWLLDHGADPNFRGYCGANCLAWAEFAGNAELCALLRERGASDELLDYRYRATPRVFPLMVFAGWGFPRRLGERLLANRSLANARGGRGTLLHAAAEEGKEQCVKVLLYFGADRSATDADGRSPVEVAVASGHAEVAELLRGA
jgi:ankyrin repeat protein